MKPNSSSKLSSLWEKETEDNLSFLGQFFKEIGKKLDIPPAKLAK
jgi:hypothetical protein